MITPEERKNLFREAEEIRREFLALDGDGPETIKRKLELRVVYEEIDRRLGVKKESEKSGRYARDRIATASTKARIQDARKGETSRIKMGASLVRPGSFSIAGLPRTISTKSLNEWAKQQIDHGVPRQDLEDFLRDLGNDEYTDRERDCIWKLEDKFMDLMVKRNLRALSHEREGKLGQAIKLYASNIADRFGGSGPYERLRILYTKQKDYANAIRACEAYLALPGAGRVSDKVCRFREHIEKLLVRQGKK